jgi:hypothetical protein
MAAFQIIWDLEDDPDGNVQHIGEHVVTPEEVEEVLFNSLGNTVVSRTSSNQVTFGYTDAGRYLAVVWEHVDDDPLTIMPVTAYDAPEP